VVTSIIFSLLLAEGLLRAIVDPVNFLRPRVVPDPILNHKLPPNAGGHDAWGFRNKTVPSTSDIVAIGDSMTYSVLVSSNNSWPSRLQKYTNKKTYNLGLGAYGPAQYLYLLEHKALTLKPSIIVIGLFLGNDFIDAYNIVYKYDYWQSLRAPDFPAEKSTDIKVGVDFSPAKKVRILERLRRFATSHLISYRLLSHAFANTVRRTKSLYFSASHPELTILSVEHPRILTAFRVLKGDRALDIHYPKMKEGLRITLEAFRRMHTLCKANNVELLVALIPTKRSVFAKYIKGNSKLKNYDMLMQRIQNEEDMRNLIKNEFQNQNIPYVDLLPDLKNRADQGIRVYPSDAEDHPLEDGYDIMAESIAAFLSNVIHDSRKLGSKSRVGALGDS
jgi:hypothetical protein